MRARIRVGVAGTGYIARGLISILNAREDMAVAAVLTRRDPDTVGDFPAAGYLTNSADVLIRSCDIVVECSGDPVHATDVIAAAVDAGLPVVTMNAEFHVTTGSWFAGRGLISEAEGDQPGSLAALREDAVEMGFTPLVYGNCKGFLDRNPAPAAMLHWSKKMGLRLNQTTSFTDGTKIQIEQALVANGLGADIARDGLLGFDSTDVETGAMRLAARARDHGRPISDYVIVPDGGVAVFVVARHAEEHRAPLRNFKLGGGPDYLLTRNYHLCYMEIPKTILRVLDRGVPLLTNGAHPVIGVAAIAKRALHSGELIERGIGSFDVRGEAVRMADHPGHAPIGLIQNATVIRDVKAGETIAMTDIELPPSLAVQAWREISGPLEVSPGRGARAGSRVTELAGVTR